MHKIAIITLLNIGYGDEYGNAEVIKSISDWKEVSDGDFELLKEYFHRTKYGRGYQIIEQIDIDEINLFDEVEKAVKAARQVEADAARKKAEQELTKSERTRQRKLKQLDKLRKELEELEQS